MAEHKVFITGTVVSDDAGYNGIEFTVSIFVTPQFIGAARTVPIEPVLPTLVSPSFWQISFLSNVQDWFPRIFDLMLPSLSDSIYVHKLRS